MLYKRYLQFTFALVTAAIVASAGLLLIMHHALMMNEHPMTHVMSSMGDSCLNSNQCNKDCDVAQTVIAPLAENVLHQVALVPLSLSLGSLSIILTLLLLAHLEPVLKGPPKLYLAYSVFRI
jgi:hypothetical protein